ncbi:MAG: hypothetical protein HXS52_00730 [Theionarchaea archaeon]|nr:hypothetical protein [Theionarchaea archaeon]
MTIFLKTIRVTPTSALTVRKVPVSYKTIASYSFVPPTTFSGFMYRILRLANDEELPTPRAFGSEIPDIDEYYILETKEDTEGLNSLGAYSMSSGSSIFCSFRMGYQHLGKGHSLADGLDIFDPSDETVKNLIAQRIQVGQLKKDDLDKFKREYDRSGQSKYFKRTVFKSVREGYQGIPTYGTFKKEGRRQPLDWYFCLASDFTGFLVSHEKTLLSLLDKTHNYGFKIGKEGFAFISGLSEVMSLEKKEGSFRSSVIIPLDPHIEHTEVYEPRKPESVYYYSRQMGKFKRGIFGNNDSLASGPYYGDAGNKWRIPLSTLQKLEVVHE